MKTIILLFLIGAVLSACKIGKHQVKGTKREKQAQYYFNKWKCLEAKAKAAQEKYRSLQ